MGLSSWCDRVIQWGFSLLFVLVPLLLTPWNYELFEYNKMMAVYALTVIITGAWLVKSVAQRELRIARTPLDIPILLFLSSQLLSSLFSIDPHVSWFGYYSRFNGGMFSVISYVLLYYAFISNLANWTNLTNLLKVALATGTVVALYGVAERLGIDKHLWVQDVQNRVFSTLGQPNWLAAYLAALVPLTWYFALQNQKLKIKNQKFWSFGFWIWNFIAVLFFLVLLFTRSRSGLLGFIVADVVFWGLVFIRFIRHRLASQDDVLRAWRGFVVLHGALSIIVFFHGTYIDSVDRWLTFSSWKNKLNNIKVVPVESTPSGTLLESGGTESGTIRKYVWQGAVNAWKRSTKTLLIGTGTETFAFAFYQFRPKEHNLTSEWDFLYNKAHNEYLNYLATTGIFGLGSYLLFIGTFIFWFIKQFLISNDLSSKQILNSKSQLGQLEIRSIRNYLFPALFAGWLSILVTNFFGFSVVVVQLFLFLFPAMAIAAEQVKSKTSQKQKSPLMLPTHALRSLPLTPIYLALLVLLVFLLTRLALLWYADTLYASGYRASRAGLYDESVEKLSRALTLNPTEPVFADELGMAYAGLVTAAIEEKDATKAADLVKRSLASSDRAIATSPKNVNFWKTRTKIYYSFSSFDPAFNDAAIEALEQAEKLSPNDPKITYNLAILYGRKGTNDKAIDMLKTTIDRKPNYRDAYYALWVFYTEVKQPDLARNVLEEYLANVDPGDKDFLERLKE